MTFAAILAGLCCRQGANWNYNHGYVKVRKQTVAARAYFAMRAQPIVGPNWVERDSAIYQSATLKLSQTDAWEPGSENCKLKQKWYVRSGLIFKVLWYFVMRTCSLENLYFSFRVFWKINDQVTKANENTAWWWVIQTTCRYFVLNTGAQLF